MSITEHALRNLVAGDLVGAVEGGVREVVNPATGDVIAEVAGGHAGRLEDYTQIKHVIAKLS